ncbi:hypothetical protein FB45DRAFT_307091 [Roridomyces roridus]|uniref:Uncharacterized protein n=1 Tax=Roridomyces roridus TaxID=1738132 RepID=A0AAD7FAD0_9AGAR|nr:hypothetical protein FB45DRAFT_307091 [Roridomyces roridus]
MNSFLKVSQDSQVVGQTFEMGPHKTAADITDPPSLKQVHFGEKLLSYLWASDQHLKSAEERKLDCGILIVATLGWFMAYVDRANIINACTGDFEALCTDFKPFPDVSGMKEDLSIHSNQYTTMQTCFAGLAIMQLQSALVVVKIRPSLSLCICILGWTAMNFFRFMVGFFESAFTPVIVFVFGSWYNKAELAKRNCHLGDGVFPWGSL